MTRGRKPLVVPTRSLHIHIDSKLAEMIDEVLWSEAEQRVPKGAYQAFFTEAAVFRMRLRTFDLSPYSGALPDEHIVYSFPGTKEILQQLLERRNRANIPGNAIKGSELARESSGRVADGSGDGRGDQADAGGEVWSRDGERPSEADPREGGDSGRG